jgi:hypothetical protein
LPGLVIDPATVLAHLHVIKFSATGLFSAFYKICTATPAPLPITNFIYMVYLTVIYKNCTATAPALTKILNRMAKSAPYLSCHRDYFVAKAPDQVAGWLRQVTQPPFIAESLAVTTGTARTFTDNRE